MRSIQDSRQGRDSYLNFSRTSDVEKAGDRRLYRFLEILPGFLSWGTIIAAFFLSWLAPFAAAIFVIVFDIIWLLRISYLSFHQLSGYRKMKKNLEINWTRKMESLSSKNPDKNWRDVYHIVALPLYKEEMEVVDSTIQSLLDSDFPKDRIIVVLTVEERAGEKAKQLAGEMERKFGKYFFRFLVTFHPKDLAGELAGKGSNIAWAAGKVKKLVIDKLSIPYEKVIFSDFDIDTRPYPQYFSCLTWHYLAAEKPLKSSFQPIPVYNNNIWRAPAFSRLIATSGTFWQMMQQERQEQLVTYSAHSMPFKVLVEVGYPSNVVSDDSRIFWKSFLHYDGDYRTIPLYYPVSMDAVLSSTFLRTAMNQYKQQRRWAFGSENIPFLIFGFLKNKKIVLKEKIRHSWIILDGFWSWATSALLIFLLGWLPLILGGGKFQTTMLSYNLPRTTSFIMTMAMVGMVLSAITSMALLPPRPKGSSPWKNIYMVLQWFLLPVTLILFGSFPALDAQARLLSKKYLGFWVTEKTGRK
jgi:cellulose synthase/poly-beta-1,6-N-acetylglucosamine synthase-like glycosyltransferase